MTASLRYLLLLAMILAGAPAAVHADDHEDDDVEQRDDDEDWDDDEDDEEEEWDEWHGADDAPAMLSRNVRLDIKLTPLEPNDRGVFLITAQALYASEATIRMPGGVHIEFSVEGRVVELDDDDRLFVTCESTLVFENQDTDAVFRVTCSARLEPGKETAVARMGDKTLTITADYVE